MLDAVFLSPLVEVEVDPAGPLERVLAMVGGITVVVMVVAAAEVVVVMMGVLLGDGALALPESGRYVHRSTDAEYGHLESRRDLNPYPKHPCSFAMQGFKQAQTLRVRREFTRRV